MRKFIFVGLLLAFGGYGAAIQADSHVCATTFKPVNTGDSMGAVKAACGEPASTTMRMDTVNTPIQTVRWFYMLMLDPKKPQMLIPAFSVSFKDGRAVQIEKNNTWEPFVGTFSCLMGDMLKPGLAMEEVLVMCGNPTSVSTSETQVTSAKEVIILTYDRGQFYPKIRFEFEAGKLVRINR